MQFEGSGWALDSLKVEGLEGEFVRPLEHVGHLGFIPMLVNLLSSSTLRPKKPLDRRGVALIFADRHRYDSLGDCSVRASWLKKLSHARLQRMLPNGLWSETGSGGC